MKCGHPGINLSSLPLVQIDPPSDMSSRESTPRRQVLRDGCLSYSTSSSSSSDSEQENDPDITQVSTHLLHEDSHINEIRNVESDWSIKQREFHRFLLLSTPSSPKYSSPNRWASEHNRKCFLSPIGVIWTALSLLTGATSIFSLCQGHWLVNTTNMSAVGPLFVCRQAPNNGAFHVECRVHARTNGHQLPSALWVLVVVLFISGSAILVGCGLLSPLLLWANRARLRTSRLTVWVQSVAVLAMGSALLLFPLEFGNDVIRAQCGVEASPYDLGTCYVGWSYMLAVVSTALATFSPLLARFTADVTLERSLVH